jgi:quercetin dioxygenase-like cupin family protein
MTEVIPLKDLVSVQVGAVVSRTLVKEAGGTVTVFAFDREQALSEHTAPFEALVLALDGEAEIVIDGAPFRLGPGDLIRLPANRPHGVRAVTPFKMVLTMIRPRSGD